MQCSLIAFPASIAIWTIKKDAFPFALRCCPLFSPVSCCCCCFFKLPVPLRVSHQQQHQNISMFVRVYVSDALFPASSSPFLASQASQDPNWEKSERKRERREQHSSHPHAILMPSSWFLSGFCCLLLLPLHEILSWDPMPDLSCSSFLLFRFVTLSSFLLLCSFFFPLQIRMKGEKRFQDSRSCCQNGDCEKREVQKWEILLSLLFLSLVDASKQQMRCEGERCLDCVCKK